MFNVFPLIPHMIQQTNLCIIVCRQVMPVGTVHFSFVFTCTSLVIVRHTKSNGTISAFCSPCVIVKITRLAIRWPGCKTTWPIDIPKRMVAVTVNFFAGFLIVHDYIGTHSAFCSLCGNVEIALNAIRWSSYKKQEHHGR